MTTPGTIYGVGLGPGDPELMSLRAHRLVSTATTIAYFRKKGRPGHARTIVEGFLRSDVHEMPLEYPMTTESAFDAPPYIGALRVFYEESVAALLARAAAGEDIVVLCEGDPFFYGSFMHLYSRLIGKAKVEVVPAITGMSGCWTATGTPITYGDDVLSVLPGTLPEEQLVAHMRAADALVVMKIGRNLPKVRRALETAGLLHRAWYVERGTMEGEQVIRLVDRPETPAPYFAMVIVHGQGRRP